MRSEGLQWNVSGDSLSVGGLISSSNMVRSDTVYKSGNMGLTSWLGNAAAADAVMKPYFCTMERAVGFLVAAPAAPSLQEQHRESHRRYCVSSKAACCL